MQEPRAQTETLPPPPGIIGSLRIGFDTISVHITAIVMPLALDLLLWLGPHLSVDRLSQPVLENFGVTAASNGFGTADIGDGLDFYKELFRQFNLLGLLRTFPIGVFSLMSGKLPTQSPLGSPIVVQVDTLDHMLGLVLLLTLVRWLLGFRSMWLIVRLLDLLHPGALPAGRPLRKRRQENRFFRQRQDTVAS